MLDHVVVDPFFDSVVLESRRAWGGDLLLDPIVDVVDLFLSGVILGSRRAQSIGLLLDPIVDVVDFVSSGRRG